MVDQQKQTTNWKTRKMAHVAIIMRAQQEYLKKQGRANLHTDSYCSIIIDGAEKSAFGISDFISRSKKKNGKAMKVKLICVQEHLKPSRVHLFTMTEEQETGFNHVMETLHRFL